MVCVLGATATPPWREAQTADFALTRTQTFDLANLFIFFTYFYCFESQKKILLVYIHPKIKYYHIQVSEPVKPISIYLSEKLHPGKQNLSRQNLSPI